MSYKDVSGAQFSFQVVAALIAASGVSVGTKHFELMAKVDSTRTVSGYEHLFRKAKKRASEIQAMEAKGELPSTPGKPLGNRKTAETKDGATKAKAGTKRGRKARDEDSVEDNMESGSKKAKKEKTMSEGDDETEATDDDETEVV